MGHHDGGHRAGDPRAHPQDAEASKDGQGTVGEDDGTAEPEDKHHQLKKGKAHPATRGLTNEICIQHVTFYFR